MGKRVGLPPLFRERLEIRLDENLDGLFAGTYLDPDRRVAEIDLVRGLDTSATTSL